MRVLITGMGGQLGTRVANLVEADKSVEAVSGVDVDPPRRRLRRAEFHRVDPVQRRRLAGIIQEFEPTVVLHLGVYEPNARAGPRTARELTAATSIAALGAAAACPSLERIVVRSGIEVYGRRRGSPTKPDEDVVPDPTSPFGHVLLHAERVAAYAGRAAGVPVTILRCAPIVGSHLASPLGRYLRLPVVPVSLLSDMPFSLLHGDDAAEAVVAAIEPGYDGPLNVVGTGAVTASQAARLGGRLPLPIVGPQWLLAKVGAELLGAPLPDHVRELLVRGRAADGGRVEEVLGIAPARPTRQVVEELHDWAPIDYLTPVLHPEVA
ncbi:MAG: NAD-dependent epimerase/dehydratase family protein [Acidimicrobiales bacterium]